MAAAEPAEPYRPLRSASMVVVLGVHAAALWGALAWSSADVKIGQAEVLAVSFVTEAEPLVEPEPLPPTPPKPVIQPKPKPLIASKAVEPVADAIVVPEEPEEEDQEPAEPIAAYTPSDEPADKVEPEPPRFDMAYLQNPNPAYPSMSKRLREEGTVALLVRVSAKGEALNVQVSRTSGYARLDDAAVRAVKQWKFKPSRRGDEAIEGMALVPIVFSLKNNS